MISSRFSRFSSARMPWELVRVVIRVLLPAAGAEVTRTARSASSPRRRSAPRARARPRSSRRGRGERRAGRERVARAVGVGDGAGQRRRRRRSPRGRPRSASGRPAALFVHTDSPGSGLSSPGREGLGGVVARADRGVERDPRAGRQRAGGRAQEARGPGPLEHPVARRRRRTPRRPTRGRPTRAGRRATGTSFSPMTVIVRSPCGVRVDPGAAGRRGPLGRRGPSRRARDRRAIDRRARASSPRAVKKSHEPARRASWTAATAPPPAGSSRKRRAVDDLARERHAFDAHELAPFDVADYRDPHDRNLDAWRTTCASRSPR